MDTISAKSTIQTAINNFQAEDETDYSAITYFSDSKSVLKLQGPLATIYNNTNFASPDFNYPGTLEKDITIPLIGGQIPQGTYILTTTTRVTKTGVPILNADTGTNTIMVNLNLLDNFVAGQTLTWTGGNNAGTYTIQSISSSAFGTLLTLTEPLTDSTTTGSLGFDEEITTVDTYSYCYEAPVPVLTMEPNCITAKLVTDQDTNYAITCEGQTIQPTTNSPSVTLNAPLNSGGSPVYPQTVSGTLPFSTTELWTGTWTATIVTTLVYELPSGLFIETSVTSTKSINVTCDDSLCCMSSCIINANTAFINASTSGNLNTLTSALVNQVKVLGAFVNYSVGVTCGNETIIENAVASLQTYLDQTDCCTDCGESGNSTQIIPIYDVIVTGDNLIVQSGDVYINISEAVVGSTTTATFTLNTDAVEALISAYIAANPTIITNIVASMGLITSVYSNDPTSFDTAVQWTGATSTGSDLIDNITFTGGSLSDLKQGDPIVDAAGFFPAGTYVLAIGASNIQVSENATGTTAPTTVFNIQSVINGINAQKYVRTIAGVDSYYIKLNVAKKWSISENAESLILDGDAQAPDPVRFYSTDGEGVRGWNAIMSELVQPINQACTAGVNTDILLKTISGDTQAGTYAIMVQAQVGFGATPPTSVTVSLLKGASIINTNALNYFDGTYGASTDYTVNIVTLEALADTNTVSLRVAPVGQDVNIGNMSIVFIRIS